MSDGRQQYIRPSGAGTWSSCAGYPALNAALGSECVEETDNEVREDGIACHWLAAELWNGAVIAPDTLAPNGRELTEEMFAAVAEYHDKLREWPVAPGWIVIEQPVPSSQYFPGVTNGTPDVWGYDDRRSKLYLADLKFGYRLVDVWHNKQLIIYAVTLIRWLRDTGRIPHPVQEVELAIYQPRQAHRDGYWRTWKPTVTELMELAAQLQADALACYAPNPLCTVNPGCGNCMGASTCVTLQAAAGRGAEVSYDATPFVLTEQQLAYELTKLRTAAKHLDHRITGLETQAESLLRKGKRIPGYEMGRKATRWRWREGASAHLRRLGELLGVDVMQEPKEKTVAQLRNAFPGIDVQTLYAEKPTGELKLVQSDPNEALKRFGQ